MRAEWNFHRIWITIEKAFVKLAPRAHFTNSCLLVFQIWWKLHLAVIPKLAMRSQQIFAHATTAQLSCHVQIFVVITLLESRSEWNEIFSELELRWKKNVKNSGAQTCCHPPLPPPPISYRSHCAAAIHDFPRLHLQNLLAHRTGLRKLKHEWFVQIWKWLRSRRCGCPVTWFCYHLIVKPGNKKAAPWPKYFCSNWNKCEELLDEIC